MASPSPSDTLTTDWSKCGLCQVDSKEQLTCPTDAGYKTIAENILQFNELHCMPVQIDVTRLDHGNGVESTFKEQNAKWHKSCYLKFGKSYLPTLFIMSRNPVTDGFRSMNEKCLFCFRVEG